MEWVTKEDRYGLSDSYVKLVCIVSDCPVLPIWLTIFCIDLSDDLVSSNDFCVLINGCYDSNYRFKGSLEEAKEYAFDVVLRPYLDKLTSLPIFSR